MIKSSNKLIIERILATAAEQRASDLHLVVGNRPILRLGGRLLELTEGDLITNGFLEQLLEIFLTEQQKKELQSEKEVTLAYTWSGKFRFKLNFFYQKGNLSVALRFIPNKSRSLAEVGLPAIVENFTKLNRGLILITGPFNSGKSTTVNSFLETINNHQSKRIVTIEKPIEFIFTNKRSIFEQREVGRDAKSFRDALDFIQDEDVEVAYVSQFEEPEVIIRGLQVAEAGRLVIGVMNVDTALKAINRLVESFGVQREKEGLGLIAENLIAVITQKLVPRVGGGHVLAIELLKNNPAIRTLILDKKIYQIQSVLLTGKEEGMISLDRSLAELVKMGEILIDDALVYAYDPNLVKLMVRS